MFGAGSYISWFEDFSEAVLLLWRPKNAQPAKLGFGDVGVLQVVRVRDEALRGQVRPRTHCQGKMCCTKYFFRLQVFRFQVFFLIKIHVTFLFFGWKSSIFFCILKNLDLKKDFPLRERLNILLIRNKIAWGFGIKNIWNDSKEEQD